MCGIPLPCMALAGRRRGWTAAHAALPDAAVKHMARRSLSLLVQMPCSSFLLSADVRKLSIYAGRRKARSHAAGTVKLR